MTDYVSRLTRVVVLLFVAALLFFVAVNSVSLADRTDRNRNEDLDSEIRESKIYAIAITTSRDLILISSAKPRSAGDIAPMTEPQSRRLVCAHLVELAFASIGAVCVAPGKSAAFAQRS